MGGSRLKPIEKSSRVRGFWRLCAPLARLARDEGGQATVEYIIILSAVVGTAVAFSRGILRGLNDGILLLGGALEKDLKTGRATIGIWEN